MTKARSFWGALAPLYLVVAMMVLAACQATTNTKVAPSPASTQGVELLQQGLATATTAVSEIDAATTQASAIPSVTAAQQPFVDAVKLHLVAARAWVTDLIAGIPQVKTDLDKVEGERVAQVKATAVVQAKFDRDHKAYAWLGWKTWAIIDMIWIAVAIFGTAAIVIGIYSQVFTAPWAVGIAAILVHIATGGIGLVFMLIEAIGPTIGKVINWIGSTIAGWCAKTPAPATPVITPVVLAPATIVAAAK